MNDSTMTLSEAQAEAAKWGNLIRALSRLQEAAETIGQLDRNRAERQAQVDQLGEEISMANEHLTELQRAVTEAEARAIEILDEARTGANELLSRAQTQADQLLADARAKADQAEADFEATRSEIQALQSQRAQTEGAVSTAQARLAAARAAARAVIEE